MVFELNADLPLIGLVPDERVFEQLLSGRTLGVVLHQAALDEAEELLRPDQVQEMLKYIFGSVRTTNRCYKTGFRCLTHHFLDLSRGGGFLGMRKSALIGCMSQRAERTKSR